MACAQEDMGCSFFNPIKSNNRVVGSRGKGGIVAAKILSCFIHLVCVGLFGFFSCDLFYVHIHCVLQMDMVFVTGV